MALMAVCFWGHPAATEQGNAKSAESDDVGSTNETSEGHDRYGDPLPEDALARLGTLRFRHEGRLTSVAFSPDGALVASADHWGTARVWEAGSGREIAKFEGKIRGQAVGFSSDGKTLLAVRCPGLTIQKWDVATGKLLDEVPAAEQSEWIGYSLVLSPDCRFVGVTGGGDECGVYEVNTGKSLCRFAKSAAFISCAISHDGKTLATAGRDKVIRFWDIASSKSVRECATQGPWVDGMQFSPSDDTLAVAGGATLQVLEVRTGKELLNVRDVAAGRPAYTADGKKLFAGREETIRTWDTAGWKEAERFKGVPCGRIGHLVISRDGRALATAGRDHIVQVWDLAKGYRLKNFGGHRGVVLSVATSPDGKTVVSGGDDGSLCVWDCGTGKLRHRLVGHQWGVLSTAISPDGKMVATGDGLPGLSCKEEATIRLWDLQRCVLIREFSAHANGVYGLAFSSNGKYLASCGGEDRVRLWDPDTGEERKQLHIADRRAQVRSIAFSRDGKQLITGDTDGSVNLWQVETGKESGELRSEIGPVVFAALLPDASTLLSARLSAEGTIQVSDLGRNTTKHSKTIHVPHFLRCALSSDGRLLAIAREERAIQILSVDTGETVAQLAGHRGNTTSLAFSLDGSFLVSGSEDTTLLVWDIRGAKFSRSWLNLSAKNDAIVNRSIEGFLSAPKESVPYLARRLQRGTSLESQVEHLVDGLNDEAFSVRQTAKNQLLKLGPPAEFFLLQRLRRETSAEVRREGEAILHSLRIPSVLPATPPKKGDEEPILSEKRTPHFEETTAGSDERTYQRALSVLSRIGTPEAREVLTNLSRGDARSWFGQQAKAALKALGDQRPSP
jgi:WD40 repeat protein